jgi:hypothetical protein
MCAVQASGRCMHAALWRTSFRALLAGRKGNCNATSHAFTPQLRAEACASSRHGGSQRCCSGSAELGAASAPVGKLVTMLRLAGSPPGASRSRPPTAADARIAVTDCTAATAAVRLHSAFVTCFTHSLGLRLLVSHPGAVLPRHHRHRALGPRHARATSHWLLLRRQ